MCVCMYRRKDQYSSKPCVVCCRADEVNTHLETRLTQERGGLFDISDTSTRDRREKAEGKKLSPLS